MSSHHAPLFACRHAGVSGKDTHTKKQTTRTETMLMRCTYCPKVSRSSSIASSTDSAFCSHNEPRQDSSRCNRWASAVQDLHRERLCRLRQIKEQSRRPHPHGLGALDWRAALVHGLHFLQLDGAEQLVQVEVLLGLQSQRGPTQLDSCFFLPNTAASSRCAPARTQHQTHAAALQR